MSKKSEADMKEDQSKATSEEEKSEADLEEDFARSYKYIHPHLQQGFMRADLQSNGLSPKWNTLLLGSNDGGRNSFRNLSEHLCARAAAGSCRLQQMGREFRWTNADGCVVEEPHPGVYVFRELFAKDWCDELLAEIDNMQSAEVCARDSRIEIL
jgi:hypothetical protein